MNTLRTAEDLAREIAEESGELELYYEEISSRQPLRRLSDHLPSSDKAEDNSAHTSGANSERVISTAASQTVVRSDQVKSSYQQFLDEHAELAKQTTGMASGVWIDAAEFSAGNGDWHDATSEKDALSRGPSALPSDKLSR